MQQKYDVIAVFTTALDAGTVFWGGKGVVRQPVNDMNRHTILVTSHQ